jgi:hypothetical protein
MRTKGMIRPYSKKKMKMVSPSSVVANHLSRNEN